MQRLPLALAALWLILPAAPPARAEEPRKDPEAERITSGPADWPWWRGPDRNGIADPKQKPPRKWSESENVLWKAPVPGRGHGSPTVVGDQVFLATADHEDQTQSVLCYDRQTGKRLWQAEVHRGGFEKKGNAKSSLACCTVACGCSSPSCTPGRSTPRP
jgi:hypothetical protein